jgi:PhzF family phenazine biosynthesis protein
MAVPIYIVDAFTETPFGGNQAGVCILEKQDEEKWMQSVAQEMGFAETAFLDPSGDGYNLRWFTPTIEVDLCGHATLASAHILWQTGRLKEGKTAKFQTKSGELIAYKKGDTIRMDFPAEPAEEMDAPPTLRLAISKPPVWVGHNRMDMLVQLESAEDVRTLGPSINAIAMLGGRGVIVTAASDTPEYDFVYRFFAPAAGVPEDNATGSAQCALGPFWKERLNKGEMTSFQASPRGAILGVEVKGDRVDICGKAFTMLEGTLLC